MAATEHKCLWFAASECSASSSSIEANNTNNSKIQQQQPWFMSRRCAHTAAVGVITRGQLEEEIKKGKKKRTLVFVCLMLLCTTDDHCLTTSSDYCVVFLTRSAGGKNDVCAFAEIKKRREGPKMSRAPECHPNDCRNDGPFSQHFVPAAFIRAESNCNCSRLLLLLLYFTSNNSRCKRKRRGFTISVTLISSPNYHLAFSSGGGGTGSP